LIIVLLFSIAYGHALMT